MKIKDKQFYLDKTKDNYNRFIKQSAKTTRYTWFGTRVNFKTIDIDQMINGYLSSFINHII